ncbi:MAG: amino acid ABC transporter ATP-binding protein, partial [Christensenellales bacterium]
SGKTTLLRCINFLETPDEGVMTLDGETLFNSADKKSDSYDELREKRLNFGLVFQSFNLFPQYSVLNNITLAPNLLLKEKFKELKKTEKNKSARAAFLKSEKEKIDAEAESLLVKTGLFDKRNAYPCELSGGQQQRVAIARALALKPKVLCFDEPTSALDPELTGEVLKVIRSLKDEDRTMIIVTHEMGFAKNVSDKVVFMADGIVEEAGDPHEVFDCPKSPKLKSFLSNVTSKDGE